VVYAAGRVRESLYPTFDLERAWRSLRMSVISEKTGDGQGRYSLDYVPQLVLAGEVDLDEASTVRSIVARDPATLNYGWLSTKVKADGERRRLDLVLMGRGSVEGIVRNGSGRPEPGAQVRVAAVGEQAEWETSTKTDQNGAYRVAGIPVGPVSVQASTVSGLIAWADGVVTASPAPTKIDITLLARWSLGAIAGDVRRWDGSAVSNALVRVATALAPKGTLSKTDVQDADASGTFRFDDLPLADYTLTAADENGITGAARVSVTAANGPETPAFVRIVLGATANVSGTVYEPSTGGMVPVPGAWVSDQRVMVVADAEGRYELRDVPLSTTGVEAANPVTGAFGGASLRLLTPGQVVTGIDIVVEAIGNGSVKGASST